MSERIPNVDREIYKKRLRPGQTVYFPDLNNGAGIPSTNFTAALVVKKGCIQEVEGHNYPTVSPWDFRAAGPSRRVIEKSARELFTEREITGIINNTPQLQMKGQSIDELIQNPVSNRELMPLLYSLVWARLGSDLKEHPRNPED